MTKEEFKARAKQIRHADDVAETVFWQTREDYEAKCKKLSVRYAEMWESLLSDDVVDDIGKAKGASVTANGITICCPERYKHVDIILPGGEILSGNLYRPGNDIPEFRVMWIDKIKQCWEELENYTRYLNTINDLIPSFYEAVCKTLEDEVTEKLDALDVLESVSI